MKQLTMEEVLQKASRAGMAYTVGKLGDYLLLGSEEQVLRFVQSVRDPEQKDA